jgi:hypothetical protein
VVARGGRAAQVLSRDQNGVPAIVQQVGERRPQPCIALARRHHPGVQRVEQPVDQGYAVSCPCERIAGLVVPRHRGIESEPTEAGILVGSVQVRRFGRLRCYRAERVDLGVRRPGGRDGVGTLAI